MKLKFKYKNTCNKILLILMALVVNALGTNLLVAGDLELGFTAGISVPNEKISSFFNSSMINGTIYYQNEDKFDSTKCVGKFIEDAAANFGYNAGVRLRAPLNNIFFLYGGLSFNRFTEGKYEVRLPDCNNSDSIVAKLRATTNIVPINVGVTGYLFKKFIGVYGLGELTYNFISTSIDYDVNQAMALPISTSYSKSRLGCGVGAGVDFDIKLFLLGLEAKYNLVNVIRNDDEAAKNYLNISLVITF